MKKIRLLDNWVSFLQSLLKEFGGVFLNLLKVLGFRTLTGSIGM